jgi:hypothetical protein
MSIKQTEKFFMKNFLGPTETVIVAHLYLKKNDFLNRQR